MIFLGLIVGVIVLSAVMSWAGVSVTTDVAEPVPTTVSQTDNDAGSTYPSITQDAAAAGPRLRGPPGDHRGQEPAQR